VINAHVEFWKGEFGDSYIRRNNSQALLESNKIFFEQIFEHTLDIHTYLEIGANIGMNVRAINAIRPDLVGTAIEPNHTAHSQLSEVTRTPREAINASIQEFETSQRWDLVFTKGVLIHVTPDDLVGVYKKMASLASRYVVIAEYYNPSPVSLNYRGHADRLFKRDFAGEFLSTNPEFKLREYRFVYKGDPIAPQDDITWFLMERFED
jgi:pseudaminic acid biosynthesis-associated methylase